MPEPESPPKKPDLLRRVQSLELGIQVLELDVATLKMAPRPRAALSGAAIRAAVTAEFDGAARLRVRGAPEHLAEAAPETLAELERAAWGRVAAKLAAQG